MNICSVIVRMACTLLSAPGGFDHSLTTCGGHYKDFPTYDKFISTFLMDRPKKRCAAILLKTDVMTFDV